MKQRAEYQIAAQELDFTPENRLILRCARVDLSVEDRRELRALANSDLDWDAAVQEILRQSLVPLVYRHLNAHCSDLVPGATLAELKRHYLLASARSLALAAELREIASLLEGASVPFLPYKGPVLALQAYGDIALRTFTDIDLIVRPGDVRKARNLLAARGYTPLDELTPPQEAAVLRFDHNLPLVRAEARVVLELHWRVAPLALTFAMPTELLWSRASTILLAGQPVRAMSQSDLILVLAVHGTRHAWSALEWVAGIAELMRQPGAVDWDRVIREADEFRVGRAVRLALALASGLLGAPLPDHVVRWIDGDSRITQLLDWVAARLFRPLDLSAAAEQAAVFRFELAVKDGTRDRIRDGLARIFLPTAQDWSAAAIPDALFPIYALLRPMRLLARVLRIRRKNRRSDGVGKPQEACSASSPGMEVSVSSASRT